MYVCIYLCVYVYACLNNFTNSQNGYAYQHLIFGGVLVIKSLSHTQCRYVLSFVFLMVFFFSTV